MQNGLQKGRVRLCEEPCLVIGVKNFPELGVRERLTKICENLLDLYGSQQAIAGGIGAFKGLPVLCEFSI